MVMIRCSANQHFYDPEKHDACPYCRGAGGDERSQGIETQGPMGGEPTAGATLQGETTPTVGMGAPGSTERLRNSGVTQVHRPDPVGDTVGIFKKEAGFEPVVGWLVCVDGSQKGRDYRIKPGTNEIGRDPESATGIALGGEDTTISRRWHAVIEYLDEENEFYLNSKENLAVWLNEKRVMNLTKLEAFDRLRFGSTPYVFVPLCSEVFKWVPEDEPPS